MLWAIEGHVRNFTIKPLMMCMRFSAAWCLGKMAEHYNGTLFYQKSYGRIQNFRILSKGAPSAGFWFPPECTLCIFQTGWKTLMVIKTTWILRIQLLILCITSTPHGIWIRMWLSRWCKFQEIRLQWEPVQYVVRENTFELNEKVSRWGRI